ncbi:MAG: ice-binding family protein [Pseudomonadota bacterium]
MNHRQKHLPACLLALAALFCTVPIQGAWAQTAPSLGAAEDFAVLGGTAVTCTDSAIQGNVGVDLGGAVTQVNCTISGTVHVGDTVAQQAYDDFLLAYADLAAEPCTNATLTGLGGQILPPGVYCFNAAVTETNTVLTLDGPADGIWIFKIGTSGTGALTGTNFSVVMPGGETCNNNVFWWTAEAATLTDSVFLGSILAGTSNTVTRGSLDGQALAKAADTLTGTSVCTGGPSVLPTPPKPRCNQGIGNGPEGCDPGNSTLNPFRRSNDELGGAPGDPGPGRKGGNKK